jgi:hypothetical protein
MLAGLRTFAAAGGAVRLAPQSSSDPSTRKVMAERAVLLRSDIKVNDM